MQQGAPSITSPTTPQQALDKTVLDEVQASENLEAQTPKDAEAQADADGKHMRISTIAPFDSTIPPFDPTTATFDPMQMDREVVLQKLLDFSHYGPRLEAEGYRLHTIYPPKFYNSTIPRHQYKYSPIVPRDTPGIRAVLVVDCEVVKNKNNLRMLASVSAIDFFTKEILVNSLVEPAGEVVDWLSHRSGVTQKKMKSARRSGTIMQKWQDAREELWKFMDPKTILIGHTLVQSLEVLGIMHGNIVDTAIVTSEAVLHPASQDEQLRRKWSLRVLWYWSRNFSRDGVGICLATLFRMTGLVCLHRVDRLRSLLSLLLFPVLFGMNTIAFIILLLAYVFYHMVLSKEFLKIEIQSKATGHTSLLDTFAIRNVIIRCIADEKGLRAWAENASIENQQGLTQRMKKGKCRLEKWKALKKAECKKRAHIDTKEGPKDT
ncbi:unnamed protein product [Penicillium salamii]|nr:unnamed protein product [Penicillium salamii]CAG8285914.1 unnamed protein product [Penicillium salamii]CAG8398804.1 unnamed protein product [Penicillium salamii]